MKVGKKYIGTSAFVKGNEWVECLFVTPGGRALVKWFNGPEALIEPQNQGYWKEYKEPKKGKFFVNIYPNGYRFNHCVYSLKKMANEHASKDRIACVEVNWTEGEGL